MCGQRKVKRQWHLLSTLVVRSSRSNVRTLDIDGFVKSTKENDYIFSFYLVFMKNVLWFGIYLIQGKRAHVVSHVFRSPIRLFLRSVSAEFFFMALDINQIRWQIIEMIENTAQIRKHRTYDPRPTQHSNSWLWIENRKIWKWE